MILLEFSDEIFGDDVVNFSIGVFLALFLFGQSILDNGEFAQFAVHSFLTQSIDELERRKRGKKRVE